MLQINFFTVLCLIGFANALILHLQYLRFKKNKKKIYCLIGESCTQVVDSKYGQTLGIKNERWGMLFYAFLILTTKTSSPTLLDQEMYSHLPIFATAFAAIFSLHLLHTQTMVLKSYCSWCLIAIAINLSLFVVSIYPVLSQTWF